MIANKNSSENNQPVALHFKILFLINEYIDDFTIIILIILLYYDKIIMGFYANF